MANYYGYGRTNAISVTDPKKFKDLINNHTMSDDEGITLYEKDGKFTILGVISGYVDNTNDDDQMPDYDSFCEKMQALLPDNEALIIQEVGHEKLRYLIGDMTIVTNKQIINQSFTTIINQFKKQHPEYQNVSEPY